MKRGSIVAVCRSDRKGVPKRAIESGRLVQGHGLCDDAHAGKWHRQVSILDIGDIREMEAKGLTLRPGAFGENLVIADINTPDLGLGSRLKVGEAEIEITQIGKVCHDRCAIYYSAGDCIMPRRGLFAEVRADGLVRAGDPVEIVHQVPRDRFQVAVLMSRGGAGKEAVEYLKGRGEVHMAWFGTEPKEKSMRDSIRQLCGRGLDLLLVFSYDAHVFSGAVDDGTEIAALAGVRGRVSKTLVAMVGEGRSAAETQSFCAGLLGEIHREPSAASLTLPTVSAPAAGA